MTQADDQWLGRGGQGVDSVRVGVLLVPLGGWRHPSCDHAATSSYSPVPNHSGGATDSVLTSGWCLRFSPLS